MRKHFRKILVLIAIIPIIITSSFADDITINTTNGGQVIHTHDGDTTINVGASISYNGNIALDYYTSDGDIFNYGTIETIGGSYAIYHAFGTGNITNYKTGIISASGTSAIHARKLTGNIYNDGTISAGNLTINARELTGNIYNDGTIEAVGDTVIYAYQLTGNIYNDGTITAGGSYAINAGGMTGNIYNDGIIEAVGYFGISAVGMIGNIYNDGTITADNLAINAPLSTGNIYNYGIIEAADSRAISVWGMDGVLYNYSGATIKAADLTIYSGSRDTTIYNEGLIWATAGRAIFADNYGGATNIIGDGEIIGNIDAGNGTVAGSVLNITSTSGVDLDQAGFYSWETINFLGTGDITLQSGAVTSSTILNFDTGGTLTLTGIDHGNINLNMQSGTYAFNSGTTVESLSVQSGVIISTTINIGAGTAGVLNVTAPRNGVIADGAILNIAISGTWNTGDPTTFLIFDGGGAMSDAIDNNGFDLILSGDYTSVWDANYEWLSLSLNTFADSVGYYQTGFAKFMDATANLYSVEVIEDLLAQYDYSGYASLAHSQLSAINSRLTGLHNRLSGYEESTRLEGAHSAMATANKPIRDANGNAVWFDFYSYEGSLNGEAGNSLDYDGYELAVGLDHAVNDNLIIGFGIHYNENSGEVATVNYDSEAYGLDFYGQYKHGQLSHKFLAGFSQYSNVATRIGAKADFDSDEFYISYRGEYTIKKESFDIIPLFGLRYAVLNIDDVTEGSGYGLEGYDYESIQTELGFKLLKAFEKSQVWGSLSWLQELGDTDVDAKGSSEFGNFDQKGLEADETIFRASLGLNTQLSEHISLTIEYAHEFGDNTEVDSIDAKISFSF